MEVRVPRWQPDLLAPPPSPVLHAQFHATTTSGDSKLIIVSLFVAGARRPLRALLDSGATNNFFRESCLSILPAGVPVRDLPVDVIVKLADGKPRRVARLELSLPYTFDGFNSNDNFIVFEMNYAFDCILGIPWLVRYQPQIDWLARSVKPRQDFDVTEVFTHLLVAPRDWPHVTVVDGESTTHVVRRASDGPLCTTCAVLLTGDDDEEPARGRASKRRAVEHPWLPPMKNETVEQRLPYVKEAVEQWFPPSIEAVKKRFPSTNEAVEQWFPHANEAFEQRLPHANGVVEKRLPHSSEAVERGLPHDDAAVEQELPPRANGAVENGLSRRDEGEASSSESDTSVSSRGSRRTKTSRRSQRRLKLHRAVDIPSALAESVCTVEYVDGASCHRGRESASRRESAEPKSAREERFAAQSWESLKASGDPIYETAREFADVFPDKTPAELPADRDESHEIDLAPGSKYCVTRQWSLPRDQVKAIDDFFEGRRQAGHVRESISPHSSPTFCVKKATGGWRIVHAFNKLNDATIPAQTPIPRKDMVLDSMTGSVIYSAIDLTDGIYQILMRESDIPLRAVSTPSGMLWEWLVIPQGLKNAHATFNCMVSHVLRPQSR
ncbi:hypothetical protein PR001_g8104 [Phytophthora rubi]|uniref:Reverse transcriptase domain-containing protein n=2 Tax=Phytophthora TaxID=4783 RepID=A0A6A3N3V3_9STRA|nr:hypothetical protein PR001_g8104 [Phytophthora rubi]